MSNSYLRICSLLTVAFGLTGLSAQAQCLYTSTPAGGLFSDPATWVVTGPDGTCGTMPDADSRIVITSPVVLDVDFTLSGGLAQLVLTSGGELVEDTVARTLFLGTHSNAQLPQRLVMQAGSLLRVSEVILDKSELLVDSAGKAVAQCNLTLDNLAMVTANGAVEVNGNLNLVTGNALLQGLGTLLIKGCVTGSNGALNSAIQGNLLVCVQNGPTTCGTGICNGDIPINNDSNCLAIVPPPLPVELVSFTGCHANGTVKLRWQTASEQQARAFRIERSATGRDFASIGEIAAAGTSSRLRNYEWADTAPVVGRGFYRLRQLDLDGTSALSSVITVRTEGPVPPPLVLPTATAGEYRVSRLAGPSTVLVMTAQGTVIGRHALPAEGGSVRLPASTAGLYFLRMASTVATHTVRLAYAGN